MIYSGEQIRITLNDGEEIVYRGNAYTLSIHQYEGNDRSHDQVNVYRNGDDVEWFYAHQIKSIVQDGFGKEVI